MIRLFLSASVPLPGRNEKYMATADVLAIRDSVKALVTSVLDKGLVVFGGHPAITPLIALLMRGLPPETRRRVVLFQSAFFERDFLDENDEFIDLRLTPAVPGDRAASLQRMRQEMIAAELYDAAIFVGGMEGIHEEYHAFHKAHPHAPCFPIASTGAAALELYKEVGQGRRDLIYELTYPILFRNLLAEIAARKQA
jgi:hypothetical protein